MNKMCILKKENFVTSEHILMLLCPKKLEHFRGYRQKPTKHGNYLEKLQPASRKIRHVVVK